MSDSTATAGPGKSVNATLPASATTWAAAATAGMVSQSTIQPPARRATAMLPAMNVVP